MRRALLIAFSAVTVVACNNLHLTEGNAYPCDFSKPPGQRDTPCLGTDVCSINNVCVAFVNEGPRFEGGITVQRLPTYARAGFVGGFTFDDPVRLHPGVLSAPITALAVDALRPSGTMVVGTASGIFTVKGTTLGPRGAAPFPFPDAGDLGQALLLTVDDGGVLPTAFDAVVGLVGGKLACAARTATGDTLVCEAGADATRLRASLVPLTVQVAPPPARGTLPLQAISNGQAFQVELRGPPATASLQAAELFDVPGAVDVAALNHAPQAATPVVLAQNGLYLRQPDAGFEPLSLAPFGEGASLGLNFASTLLTAHNRGRLSTWEVSVTAPPDRTHTLSQAWPDCDPCRGAAIVAVTPQPPSSGVGVEVLCRGDAGFSLVRVTGSNAAAPQDACDTQSLTPPLDPAQLTGALTVANAQRGIAFGNERGNVWAGQTLSEVLPLALERVPLDVTTIRAASGESTLVAITDRYLAAFDPTPPSTGFRRVPASEFNVGDDLRFVSAVRGDRADGWGVLSNGVVAHAELREGGNVLRFGPRLVTPSGGPMARSVGGEAYVSGDGGVAALFVTADDGLYAVFNPEAMLGDSPGGALDVTPELQPEPSVPIRSLALERTPLGTNGTTRARGYLVTSRNVYEWALSGTPARWSSKQLVLGGGEPVEVWFDTERSALGRVGYADGQIFTLPSGFQLTLPLPGDDAAPVKVLDYANFGGWPVALTTTGLFAASWDVDPATGKVQNRFDDGRSNRPMEWRRLTLADGTEPWKGLRGKLFVRMREGVGADCGETFDDKRRIYTLSVFLPGEVRKLADYCRN